MTEMSVTVAKRRRTGLALAALVIALVGCVGTAHADPVVPVPIPIPRPMPADPSRVNPIGGARISSTTPQGETAGLEQPLAAVAERSNPTVPMWAKDGIFLPTAHPNRQLVVHLPGELGLGPAAWTGDGGAVYGSNDVDYQVIPFSGGGMDIKITRKSIFSGSSYPIGVKLPVATHLRQGVNVVLVETDPAPGDPAHVIGTFSIAVARDARNTPIAVTPGIGAGFPNQSALTIELGEANIFAFPVTITMSYRASDIPTSGALTPDWDGIPPQASALADLIARPADYVTDPGGALRPDGVDPVIYAQRHSGQCQGGPNQFTAADGRSADFLASCQTQQQCLAATPTTTSVDSCDNRLFANMSAQCVATFGQVGDDYDACVRTASEEVSWVKANMAGGPG
ncbi:hypothetical protein QN239_31445 [Mycolicibacterium sp. Y3]